MGSKRWKLWYAVGLVVVVGVCAVVYRVSGSVAVESWVGTQLLGIGASYLEPELTYERLTYVRPHGVVLENVALWSPDPGAGAGKKVAILRVKRADLTLTETPRKGQPLRFSEIVLDSPEVRVISDGEGRGFLGFSKFMKGKESRDAAAEDGGVYKASDFLSVRRVAIRNGLIAYDARQQGAEPMQLDQINTTLLLQPGKDAGVYEVQARVTRDPVLRFAMEGQANVDTLAMEVKVLSLAMGVNRENLRVLPPGLQRVLRQHEVTGDLKAEVRGWVSAKEPGTSAVTGNLRLEGGRFVVGEYQFGTQVLAAEVTVGEGRLRIDRANAAILGGEAQVRGMIPLAGEQPVDLELAVEGVRIEQTLRERTAGALPRFAGSLTGRAAYTAPRAGWRTGARGGGRLSLREGRIEEIPGLRRKFAKLDKVFAGGKGDNGKLTDWANIDFALQGDRVVIERFVGQSGEMGLRGGGAIGFDGRLDLRLNAGPLEGLQQELGRIGRAWASASDAVAGYRVTGTLREPVVGVEVGR